MKHVVRLAWLALLAAGAARADENSLVGEWMSNVPGPTAGMIYSFRDDGSVRLLIPLDDKDLAEYRSAPKDQQAKMAKGIVTLNGKTYLGGQGTWMKTAKDTIHTVFKDPNGVKPPNVEDFTVRFSNKNFVSLLQPNSSPTMLVYVNVPLPKQ